jgi:hypothetical protein
MKTMHQRNGQAALTLVLLVGGIAALTGVGLAFLSTSIIQSGRAAESGGAALAAAGAGTRDALLRLARDNQFEATTPYTIPVDTGTVAVTVTRTVANEARILSVAQRIGFTRKVETVVTLDPGTGVLTIRSSLIIP